jgi:cytosine/adenosine deaminase-related metal-dependent hydrolase
MDNGDSAYVLEGRVVTMNARSEVLDPGRVYVRGRHIAVAQRADAPAPQGFEEAAVVRTGGTIYPGLIELHNHLPYNVLPLWQVPRQYSNRGQWGSGNASYRARISGPMGVLGRVAGYIEAVVRYVEVKCLLAGVTTSQGVALFSNAGARRYYRGLVRNVEHPLDDDLPAADTRVADVEAQHAAGFLDRLQRSSCLLLHLAEGVDDVARSHFRALRVDERRWAITDALSGIHCAGLRGRDFASLRSRGGTMVWSPLSNLLLYGETADIARAGQEGVLIGLGSDWSPSGSKNLLGEMKVAWLVAQDRDAGLDARDIVAMATINGARILKWDRVLGSLEAGKLADLLVVNGQGGDPYEHLLRARETSITLVVIDGQARYGQPRMMNRLAERGEALQVGESARVIDLTDAASDPIVGALSLTDARDLLAEGMRRLPELAAQMDQTGVAAAALGTASATEPGAWFLELDHEPIPGFSPRPQLALDGVATGVLPELFLAAPLAEIVEPMELDPLTTTDDETFFDRLAESGHLPELILQELPPLYGERPRKRVPPAELAAIPSAEGIEGPVPLAERLDRCASTLSAGERRLLVQQATVLLEQSYVHLQLKRSMHAVDPVQRLRLLRHRLDQPDEAMSDLEFHHELASIFASLRDLHTNYLLPSPLREHTAFLPFLVEEYFDDNRDAHYTVTKLVDGFEHPTFVPGVEVLHWNGTPIRRAIAANAVVQGGSNPAAAWARGLEALTIRPLVRSLPPEEDWVTVTYKGLDGPTHETRWDWLVWAPPPGIGVDPDDAQATSQATALGYDLQTDAVTHAKKVLFAPAAFAEEQERGPVAAEPVAIGARDVPTSMPTVFRARTLDTDSGTFTYLRIFTFNVPDADVFVQEFSRLVASLPPNGLIVDVRGNGGGLIYAAERLLQVFTPRPIRPSPAQFITTALMLDLCERHAPSPLDPSFDLRPWIASMRQAVTTGAVYSQAVPITDPESANQVGQTYQGPVVLITDALCYSATDMFAAGFKDHHIGTILGIADNTGAGGANVWTHELLRLLMDTQHPAQPAFPHNPFRPLPHNAGMRVSVRRTTRVGALDGTPLEDLGVEPDNRHHMTRDDILHGNRDLFEHAAALLKDSPTHRLDFDVQPTADGDLELTVHATNIDRVDVNVDGRPTASFDIVDHSTTQRIRPPSPKPAEIQLQGFLNGVPAARAKRTTDR